MSAKKKPGGLPQTRQALNKLIAEKVDERCEELSQWRAEAVVAHGDLQKEVRALLWKCPDTLRFISEELLAEADELDREFDQSRGDLTQITIAKRDMTTFTLRKLGKRYAEHARRIDSMTGLHLRDKRHPLEDDE